MISIFRKIRERFIGEGNVRRYLLYAIGEILLVVIGILIALQVNNWNESRLLKSQEKTYLKLLRDDLILQKEENEAQRTLLLKFLATHEELTGHIGNRFKVEADQKEEVKTAINKLLIGRTYGGYEATYVDLTSSGSLVLISNQQLKNLIIQHYQVQKRDRDVINNNTLNTYKDLWIKMVERNVILLNSDFDKLLVSDEGLKYDPSLKFLDMIYFRNLARDENLMLLQNVVAFKKSITAISLNFLDNSDRRINRIIEAIDRELGEL